MQAINTSITNFANTAQQEASTIFGNANTVFNSVWGGLKKIVSGGPSQMGFSQNQLNAQTAAAVQAGATEARNLRGAAATSTAAIGGGNVALPAGFQQTATMTANEKAAADTAASTNAIINEGYQVGNENYWKAVGAGEQAPGVYGASTAANKNVTEAQTAAATSQQDIDNSANWWANDIMKLGSAAVGGFTSGLGGGMPNSASKSGGSMFSTAGGGAGVDSLGSIPTIQSPLPNSI